LALASLPTIPKTKFQDPSKINSAKPWTLEGTILSLELKTKENSRIKKLKAAINKKELVIGKPQTKKSICGAKDISIYHV